MLRQPPPSDSFERARHGGTTPPPQESVWDLTPQSEQATFPAQDDDPPATVSGATLLHVEDALEVEPPAVPTPRSGRAAGLVIAGVAIAVIAGGAFFLTSRTSDAGAATPTTTERTESPPSIAELASSTGATDALDQFTGQTVPSVPAPRSTAAAEVAAPATTEPTVPETTLLPTTIPATTVPATTIPATTVPATTTPTTAPATVPPVVAGPQVEIVTRTEPCKFGASCLVAGYILHGFDSPPAEFVCEFASGNRFTFSAGQFAVDRACATGTPGDSITIEVGGIRSDTVAHG